MKFNKPEKEHRAFCYILTDHKKAIKAGFLFILFLSQLSSPILAEDISNKKGFHSQPQSIKIETCISDTCHADMQKSRYVHAPIATGICLVCHVEKGAKPPLAVEKKGAELCLGCHEQQKTFISQAQFIHEPINTSCTGCHNPHGSDISEFLLTQSELLLCANCHMNEDVNENQIPQMKTVKVPHTPVTEGDCTGCHAPHASNFEKHLKEGPEEIRLCINCHKNKVDEINNSTFKHGPVKEGLCAPCHLSHGSDFFKSLKYHYEKKFYNPYDPEIYDLCFKCHKDSLVSDKRTTVLTNFRNGDRNLHYLHVNRKKGRTCIACHDVHASSQESIIRTSTPFGNWEIPIEFSITSTGGKCSSSCHIIKQYDRITPFKLNKDIEEKAGGKKKKRDARKKP